MAFFASGFVFVSVALTLISIGVGTLFAANLNADLERQFPTLDQISDRLLAEGYAQVGLGLALLVMAVAMFWLSRSAPAANTKSAQELQ